MSLPFRDDFNNDLSQWDNRSGTWSILGAPPERYVGFRCNGERTAIYCADVADRYSADVSNTLKGGFWLIQQNKCVTFDSTINNALTTFDNAGVKVFVQTLFGAIPTCLGVYWHTQSITIVFP